MSDNKTKKSSETDKNISEKNNLNASNSEPVIFIEASDRTGTVIDVPIKNKKTKKQRRRKALNVIALANILMVGAVLAGGFAYITCLPHETRADDENRMLTAFPKFSAKNYASGKFTEGIADYFDDTVHKRSDIKQFIANTLMPLKGRKYGDNEEGAELYGSGFEKKKPAGSPDRFGASPGRFLYFIPGGIRRSVAGPLRSSQLEPGCRISVCHHGVLSL